MAAITLYISTFYLPARTQEREQAPVLMFERQSGRVCNKFIIPRTRNNNAHSHSSSSSFNPSLVFPKYMLYKNTRALSCNAVRDKYDNFWICAASDEGCCVCPAEVQITHPLRWSAMPHTARCCCVFVIQFARDTNNLQISPAATGIFRCCCVCGWEKLLHHQRANEIAPGGAVTFGLAK